jgi:hypothetical protein
VNFATNEALHLRLLYNYTLCSQGREWVKSPIYSVSQKYPCVPFFLCVDGHKRQWKLIVIARSGCDRGEKSRRCVSLHHFDPGKRKGTTCVRASDLAP